MPAPKTLRTTIIAIMGVPLLCVALLIIYYGYQEARRQAIGNLITGLTERTARQASELNLYFGKISRYADTMAMTLGATGPLERKAYMTFFDNTLDFDAINGAVVAFDDEAFSTKAPPPSFMGMQEGIFRRFGIFSKIEYYDYAYSDWFLLPKLAGEGMWTDPFFSSLQQSMLCAYGAPFYNDVFFQGVVGLSVTVENITKNLETINTQGSRLVLLSQFGTIVVHPNRDYILRHTFVSLASERESKALSDFAYSLRTLSSAGVVRFDKGLFGDNEYIAYAPIPCTKWMLLSVIPEEAVLSPVMYTVWQGIFLVILGMGVIFILGYLLSTHEIVTPLLRLENAAHRLAAGELKIQVVESATTREILSLERTFNTMVTQLRDSLNKELAAGRARLYAEETSQAKTDFLARMSHEIRTPMNAILGLTHLALAAQPPEKQKNYLLKIRRAGKSMLSLINDILDFSKIEAGMLRLEFIPFSLWEIVKTLEDLFASAAAEKDLEFRVTVSERVPAYLRGDPLRLTQILMNLCNNALKFTPQGHILVDIDSAGTDETSCALVIQVQDTGIGIAPEAQVNLFSEFTQADSSTTRKFGGTGLGLAICKLLAELMGGHIALASTLGTGSTFSVTIPFACVSDAERLVQEQAGALGEESLLFPASRILVAEDNEINQEIIKALLENMGLVCQVVSNGKQALQALSEAVYDLVLMDIQMPEMDGLTATRALRKSGFTLPVLAMTANVMETDRENCYKAGMNAHITKPIDPKELHDTLAAWLKPGKDAR